MLRKAFTVLSLFTPNRTDIGVVEAAELLRRPNSTVSRWLTHMHQAGFLGRERDGGRYHLGLQLIGFGEIARRSTFVHRLALPALRQLTAETEETTTLGVLGGEGAFDAEVVESPHVIRPAAYPGRHYPLHATAVGKVLLAWLSESEILALLPRSLRRYTPATITDHSLFLEELARTREQGFATAWGEWALDHAGIAAPVRSVGGKVIAAIALAAPISRMLPESLADTGATIMRTADRVTAALHGAYDDNGDGFHHPVVHNG